MSRSRRGKSGQTQITIYDPNALNPYGIELAGLLASRRPISLWVPQSRDSFAIPGVRWRPFLSGEIRGDVWIFAAILRRYLAPLVLVLLTPRSNLLVVVWTKGAWDAFLLTLRSLLKGRTLTIYHNPVQVRPRSGLSGRFERLLLRASSVSVHTDRLREMASKDYEGVVVLPHPPYFLTAQRGGYKADPNLRRSRDVAFVGALRPDKGVDDFLSIARASGGGWTLRILGTSRLPFEQEQELAALGVRSSYPGSSDGLSDLQMVSELHEVSTVIAPYRSVTESGSVQLALSLGAPVLGYRSDGLNHLLNDASLFEGPAQLGEAIMRFLEEPWATYATDENDRRQSVMDRWEGHVDEV